MRSVRALLLFAAALPADVLAQPSPRDAADPVTPGYTLRPDGTWELVTAPEDGTPAAELAEAARLIAAGDPDPAIELLDDWIKARRRTDDPLLARAFLLRGDAQVADGNEYEALYDYERVITDFPGSAEFIDAVAREAEIANAYLDGLKRKFLGLRIENSRRVGEELLIRVQERLPGSTVAEDAGFRLARHYFDRGDLRLAAEMYSIFRVNFPESTRAREALLGQIYSNVAAFKGPAYDASVLLEARLLLDRYEARYPLDAERDPVLSGLGKRIDESRAQSMLESAQWYLRTGEPAAARFTMRRLVRRHPGSTAAGQAARLIAELDGVAALNRAPSPAPSPVPSSEPAP